MKIKWGILLLVSGLLFFGLGCMVDSVAVEGIGAVAFFPGLTGGDGEGLEGGGRRCSIGRGDCGGEFGGCSSAWIQV